jgi:hypothetical protein
MSVMRLRVPFSEMRCVIHLIELAFILGLIYIYLLVNPTFGPTFGFETK